MSQASSKPSEPASGRRVDDPEFQQRITDAVRECGGDPESFDGKLVQDLIMTSFKLISDGRGTGELKLMNAAFKELRYAYNVFADYLEPHKVSIFGSARTKPGHPDYEVTVEFSKLMAAAGWLVITGAGDGIMKAGHEGPGREASFGLAIRLPFETTANEVIKGDSKLINFRYFFTRKLMFLSQCEAVVALPGGFGTQDELFESLTLIQTGKSSMVPVVLIEHEGGNYWTHWDNYVRRSLLESGMISPEDLNLYHITRDVQDAVDHITRFYRNFHSYRYVKDDLIIRIRKPLQPGDIERLNIEFASLVREGRIEPTSPYDAEEDHRELPRIAFTHNRRNFGMFRRMIDRINEFDPVDTAPLHPTEIY
jgi:uncharacterized protein (TIGR00730 family)